MELKTLVAKRFKCKFGLIKTKLYDTDGNLKAIFPEIAKQPHKNLKTIIINCFRYNIVFIN